MSETEITDPKETINIENVVASTGIGQDDAFAAREAAAVASDVSLLAPGLATARGVDRRRVRGLAYTRRASDLVGYAAPTVADVCSLLDAATIEREGTVAVRARDVRGSTGIDTRRVERDLGAVLTDRGFTVDLDCPDHELRALFAAPRTADRLTEENAIDGGRNERTRDETEGVCALGWLVVEGTRNFGERAPTKRPFFQPGSMDPLLARWLANVAGAGPGTTIVDPMCGTGGILVEAGLVGARVIALDAQAKMVTGTRTNLARYLGGNGIETDRSSEHDGGFAVLRGDATRIPFRDGVADGICFDVPYGRQSKVAGDLDDLVAGALAEARRLASRTVVVGDRPWTAAARDAGWVVESTFERRVHRSLTRHVAVLDSA